jgi:hypothetical protein
MMKSTMMKSTMMTRKAKNRQAKRNKHSGRLHSFIISSRSDKTRNRIGGLHEEGSVV